MQNSIIACEKGVFNGIDLGDEGTNLSLLQFADDALIFGEWSRKHIKNLISILNNFRKVSGLAINLSKSTLYGIGVSSDDIKNLVISINCKGDTKSSFILEGKLPFFWGRSTLTKSVLGFKEDSKGIYWVKWRTALAGYDQGGLGIVKEACMVTEVHSDPPLMYQFPRLYALELSEDCLIKDSWCLENKVWKRNWDWRSSPKGRAFSELQSLSSLLDGFVLCPQAKDDWIWTLSNDGLFTVKRLSSIIDSTYLTDSSSLGKHMIGFPLSREREIFLFGVSCLIGSLS
ncbi:hypothetical protein Tco_0215630 [Tanacetum coccineum]